MLAVAAQSGTHLTQLGVTDGDFKTGKRRARSDMVASADYDSSPQPRAITAYASPEEVQCR
jgi:hypothetical protein